MRKTFSVALIAAAVCFEGMTKDAAATVTFSLVWTGTTGLGSPGTNTIDARHGDQLTLTIRMTTDQSLAGHGVSINFDTDLENRLNLSQPRGGKEWQGTTFVTGSYIVGTTRFYTYGTYAPSTAGVLGPPAASESTGAAAGQINTFESRVLSGTGFLPTGEYTIGTARFVWNGWTHDETDIFVGLFNTGVDNVLDNVNVVIPASSLIFGTASVNGTFVPLGDVARPAIAGLLLITGALGLACRHRRHGRAT